VNLSLRGFQVNAKTDQAVGLMKQIKVYPLATAAAPPAMAFIIDKTWQLEDIVPVR
jgi:hypothetical protein